MSSQNLPEKIETEIKLKLLKQPSDKLLKNAKIIQYIYQIYLDIDNPDILSFINNKQAQLTINYIFDESHIKNFKEVRIREIIIDSNKTYFLTCKSEGDLGRTEFEISINSEDFKKLVQLNQKGFIKKQRYIFEINHKNCDVLELDIYTDQNKELYILEAELKNIENNNTQIADTIIKFIKEYLKDHYSDDQILDVTYLTEYKNKNLAKLNK